MDRELIIASKNKGKIQEFKQLLAPFDVKILSLEDLEDMPDVEETGATFAENAILKAEAIAERYDKYALADDSGLTVEALDGAPGIFSARYAGIKKDDDKNIEKLLEELKDVPLEKRNAKFICVLALARPGEETITFEGDIPGVITHMRQGSHGFGYDPVFYLPERLKTFAELDAEDKNKISHRGRALQAFQSWWEKAYN